jgi:flagellar protein FlaG
MIIQPTNPVPHKASQPDAGVAVSGAPVRTSVPAQPVDIPSADAAQPAPAELVQQAVDALNEAMQQANRNLEFSLDGDTGQTVVRLVDTGTGELIRQFPSEATLAIARELEAQQQGLLLNGKA